MELTGIRLSREKLDQYCLEVDRELAEVRGWEVRRATGWWKGERGFGKEGGRGEGVKRGGGGGLSQAPPAASLTPHPPLARSVQVREREGREPRTPNPEPRTGAHSPWCWWSAGVARPQGPQSPLLPLARSVLFS